MEHLAWVLVGLLITIIAARLMVERMKVLPLRWGKLPTAYHRYKKTETGKMFEFVCFAEYGEETMIVIRSEDTGQIYAEPTSEFHGISIIDGQRAPRYRSVGESGEL